MPSISNYMLPEADLQPIHASMQARQFSMKPVIVPQTTAEWSSPFTRGYSEILARQYDLSPARWLAFIDGLNQVIVKNAGLAVTNKVAGLASWAPSVIVSGVATGIQVGTGVGDRVRSKKLTNGYLATANQQLFRPRGLHCKIYDTNATLALLGLPPAAGVTMDEMLAQARSQTGSQSSYETAFRPFGDRVQPLVLVDADPSPVGDKSMMSKMNAMSVGMEKWRNNRKQQKAVDDLLKAQREGKQKDVDKAMREYASATGQSVQGLSQKRGLISGLKNKLGGGGSQLWLVVVPLDEAPEPSFEDLALDEKPALPPRRYSPPAYPPQQYPQEKAWPSNSEIVDY